MEDFNNMMDNWKKQNIPEPQHTSQEIAQKASIKMKKAKNLQYKTVYVLSSTLLVIAAFFIFALHSQPTNSLFGAGIGLMLLMLIVRIAIEIRSISVIKKASMIKDVISYNHALVDIYKSRKRLHGLGTYLIYALYVVGFCLLMPFFKQSLSEGFYQYITICAVVIFPTIAIFIFIMNKKELKVINNTIKEMERLSNGLR